MLIIFLYHFLHFSFLTSQCTRVTIHWYSKRKSTINPQYSNDWLVLLVHTLRGRPTPSTSWPFFRDYCLPALIPTGGGFNPKTRPLRVRFFIFFENGRASSPFSAKIKNCLPAGFWIGGERGIRTPGPEVSGQRFSRPPHSTALPSLRGRKSIKKSGFPRNGRPLSSLNRTPAGYACQWCSLG